MSHARLTHPTRPTLEWRQAQQDTDSRAAETNVAREIGTERKPLVHVVTQQREREVQGRITAPRRARNDTGTDDWQQALANYADELEAHCDEFQGARNSGYTFEDDIRNTSFSVVYTGLEWTLMQGQPYEFEFTASLSIGRGVMESRPIDRRNPTVDTGMSVAGRVGGEDLPGLREFRCSRGVEFDVNAIYDRDSAENNDIVPTEGTQQRLVFRGTHTGTDSQRAAADAALLGLQDGEQVTFETRWPGYDLDGFVVGYDSDLESRFGTGAHHYTLEFIEGQRA